MVCCCNVVWMFRDYDVMLLACLLFDVGWLSCAVRCSCSRFVACGLFLLCVVAIGVEVVCCFLFVALRCACCVVRCSLAVACDSWFAVCWLFVDGRVHCVLVGCSLFVAGCLVFWCLFVVVCPLFLVGGLCVEFCALPVDCCCLVCVACWCVLCVVRCSLVVVGYSSFIMCCCVCAGCCMFVIVVCCLLV